MHKTVNIKTNTVDVNHYHDLSRRQYKALTSLFFSLILFLGASINDSWVSVVLGFIFFGIYMYNDWKI